MLKDTEETGLKAVLHPPPRVGDVEQKGGYLYINILFILTNASPISFVLSKVIVSCLLDSGAQTHQGTNTLTFVVEAVGTWLIICCYH